MEPCHQELLFQAENLSMGTGGITLLMSLIRLEWDSGNERDDELGLEIRKGNVSIADRGPWRLLVTCYLYIVPLHLWTFS